MIDKGYDAGFNEGYDAAMKLLARTAKYKDIEDAFRAGYRCKTGSLPAITSEDIKEHLRTHPTLREQVTGWPSPEMMEKMKTDTGPSMVKEFNRRYVCEPAPEGQVHFNKVNEIRGMDPMVEFNKRYKRRFRDEPENEQVEREYRQDQRIRALEEKVGRGDAILTRQEAAKRIDKLERQIMSLKQLFTNDRKAVVAVDERVTEMRVSLESQMDMHREDIGEYQEDLRHGVDIALARGTDAHTFIKTLKDAVAGLQRDQRNDLNTIGNLNARTLLNHENWVRSGRAVNRLRKAVDPLGRLDDIWGDTEFKWTPEKK